MFYAHCTWSNLKYMKLFPYVEYFNNHVVKYYLNRFVRTIWATRSQINQDEAVMFQFPTIMMERSHCQE